MPPPVNVLILIHGMTPSSKPSSPFPGYESFWKALLKARPELERIITKRIGVQWGHEMPAQITDIERAWGFIDSGTPAGERSDQKLTRSQEAIRNLTSYETVRKSPAAGDKLLNGWLDDPGIPGLRGMVIKFREGMVVPGIGDVVYYCSEEGETRIRRVVYHQILRGLDAFRDEEEVRLHIFAHSMGATLSHDFLFGLFAPGHDPGFIKEKQGSGEARDHYQWWRKKAQAGELKLGSLASAASQLPLFLMRKVRFVEQFYDGQLLDSSVIGVTGNDRIRWKIFYDIDDALGFPSRRLYRETPVIVDIQVNCSALPEGAHTGYWQNETVIRETADLILENSK
ncbi:MAG: hypothetical protein HY587_07180 [Candidatus Omnitrophica bacterium]|nr:hypothetical protein [Candidatus Omnitrophota bacterium]